MKYEMIFYHSGKTAEIERTVQSKLEKLGLELSCSSAAVEPKELAEELSKSLGKADIVFVTGGLDGGVQSTDNVLSAVLSSNGSVMKSNKLVDDEGNIVYLIKCRKQTIVVFPDDTDIISKMFDAKLLSELKKTYSLKEEKSDIPTMDKITKELDTQLAGMNRVRTSVHSESIADKKRTEDIKKLKILKIAIIVLFSLGLIGIAAAFVLFFLNLS